jgi:hypothetical protein
VLLAEMKDVNAAVVLGAAAAIMQSTGARGRAANNCIILRQSRCVHTSVTHESEWLHKKTVWHAASKDAYDDESVRWVDESPLRVRDVSAARFAPTGRSRLCKVSVSR